MLPKEPGRDDDSKKSHPAPGKERNSLRLKPRDLIRSGAEVLGPNVLDVSGGQYASAGFRGSHDNDRDPVLHSVDTGSSADRLSGRICALLSSQLVPARLGIDDPQPLRIVLLRWALLSADLRALPGRFASGSSPTVFATRLVVVVRCPLTDQSPLLRGKRDVDEASALVGVRSPRPDPGPDRHRLPAVGLSSSRLVCSLALPPRRHSVTGARRTTSGGPQNCSQRLPGCDLTVKKHAVVDSRHFGFR
jgi:hypothetical protein